MLTKKQLQQIKEELDSCKNPLIFYHDDPDGLCSFLILYRYMKEGHGIPVKSTPKVDDKFLKKVEEYQPDKIFIVDIAMVEESFIKAAHTPIVWIDHHDPSDIKGVKYFNPRKDDPDYNISVSQICYEAVEQDLWIAIVGIVADWLYSEHHEAFSQIHPDLLPQGIKSPPELLFGSKIGLLAQVFDFCLKGKTSTVQKCVKALSQVKTPYEILNQETDNGKLIWERYVEIKKEYDSILQEILSKEYNEKLLVFKYPDNNMSFTGGLSNELLFRFPDKIILLGRIKNGLVRCSMRSPPSINVKEILQQALQGVEGFGGGHEHACGCTIKQEDWDRFVENIKKIL